jgi:hypothetical protein
MNYILPILLLAALPTLAQRVSVRPYMPVNPRLAILEKDNGFRDARFGADTLIFNDLNFETQIEDLGKVTRIYHRDHDNKLLGIAAATEISYYFEDGKLNTIIIKFTGKENGKAAFNYLYSRYGAGSKREHSSLGDYWWSTEHVLLSYGVDRTNNETEVSFSYKKGSPKAGR